MTLPPEYLAYPRRRRGMDQDWYAWRNHFAIEPTAWPNGAGVAVWLCVHLEFFPLNPRGQPFRAPGSMVTPYPDLRHYTSRDYGNRVGVYRLLRQFDTLGLRAGFAVNSAVFDRYPALARSVRDAGHEILAHGVDMDSLHHEALDEADESALIKQCLGSLRTNAGGPVRGWLSPARCQSARTAALLASHGIEYICDHVNDELPYELAVPAGRLHVLPLSLELSDRQILVECRHSETEYAHQVLEAYRRLATESKTYGRRILALSLTPYVTGLPYRFGALRELLERLAAQPDAWFATGAEILDAWTVPRPPV